MAGAYVLYEHRNKINGKRYIGITCNTAKRWCAKGKRYENCPHFWSAIQKYGWDSFEHTVLIRNLTLEEANVLEKNFISMFRTREKDYGYNITEGGDSIPSMLGRHHSEETKRKMREAALGRVISEKQRKQHSETMKGLLVGSRNGQSKAVRCIDTGEVFESQGLAAKAKGVLQSKIWKCCNGEATHTHGLHWEYA